MRPITCNEDLRKLYLKRVPRMFVDYCESGSWTEATLRRNLEDFARIQLHQRMVAERRGRWRAMPYARSGVPGRPNRIPGHDQRNAATISAVATRYGIDQTWKRQAMPRPPSSLSAIRLASEPSINPEPPTFTAAASRVRFGA